VVQSTAAPVSGFFAKIYREIIADKAGLPSMPDLALRIRAAMQRPNNSAATISRVVQADPGTAAYLIRVANSALYGGVARIRNVEHAVSRLGMTTTRNLVTAHALRAMFRTRSAALAGLMQETWKKSAKVAALASIIANRCPGFAADRAMLAGLLQDIGVLPLLNALERGRQPLPDPVRIAGIIELFASKVGAVLLKHWEFDEEVVEVARSREDWWRNQSMEPDLADIVLVARLHASVGGEGMQHLPLINEVPAFLKLPLGGLNPAESLEFLREAESDVRDVMQMLGV
jgi:HD-like signal output (HDOD) protein